MKDNLRLLALQRRDLEVAKEVKVTLPEFKAKKQSFIDPIGSGIFDVEVDMELFEKVESAESD